MPDRRLRPCPACGSGGFSFLCIDEGQRVVRCRECGMVHVNPTPSAEELAAHYSRSYASLDHWETTFRHDRAVVFARGLRSIARTHPRGRLLDVGCSLGFFLEAARDCGYETYGVELSGPAALFAREELGLDVFHGTLDQACFREGFFDVITMWDVLEHLDDPAGVLFLARRLLRADGLLVIRVPNILFHGPKAAIVRALAPGRAIGLDAFNHLNHYSPATLRRSLQRVGLRVMRIEPGPPNVYGRPLIDGVKTVYVSAARALLRYTGCNLANIIECYATPGGSS